MSHFVVSLGPSASIPDSRTIRYSIRIWPPALGAFDPLSTTTAMFPMVLMQVYRCSVIRESVIGIVALCGVYSSRYDTALGQVLQVLVRVQILAS